MTKKKLTPRTNTYADETPRHHFFASSAAQWRTGYDLGALIKAMQADGYAFNVWMVPGTENAEYAISNFAPQVEGATWLIFYGFE